MKLEQIGLLHKGIFPLTLEMIQQEIFDALYPNEFTNINITVRVRFLEIRKDLNVIPREITLIRDHFLDINYDLFEFIEDIVSDFDSTYKFLDSKTNNTLIAETLFIQYSTADADAEAEYYNALMD